MHGTTLEVHREIATGTKYSGIFSFAIIGLLQKAALANNSKTEDDIYFVPVAISR